MKTGIEKLMDSVVWQETEIDAPADGAVYATHVGVLDVAGFKLGCYRLSDGSTGIDKDDMGELFSAIGGG